MIHSSPASVPSDRAHSSAEYFPRAVYALVTLVSLLAIALVFLYHFMGSQPFWGQWEDSFMLVRYADNLIHGSGLIWNPGGAPTYGLTSVFYVAPVALLQAILPNRPIVTLPLTSALCGCLFLVLLDLLLRPFVRASRAVQLTIGILVVVSFGRASAPLSTHFFSGMDTMFDLSMITAYFLVARWLELTKSWNAVITMGVVGGLMYGVRPDLLIYTFLVPAAIAFLGQGRAMKIKGAAALAITACVTGLLLFALYIYFGTALPLSFYAKGLKLYGDFEYERYRAIPLKQFSDFFWSYVLLFAVIFWDLISSIRSRGRNSRSPLEVALLCGTLAFFIYYLFFVVQIMEFDSRFYYPTLPALLFLSAASTQRLIEKYRNRAAKVFRSSNGWKWTAALGVLGLALIAKPLAVNARQVSRVADKGFASWDQFEEYRAFWSDYWFRLDRFSALPHDFVFATTEIGHVAAMNPGKVVVDMAGLNETQFAERPFSANVLLQKYNPDLIYMPHPGYRSMNRDLMENPEFIRDYDYIPHSELGPKFRMGIALRRDSKYYPQMRAIVNAPN